MPLPPMPRHGRTNRMMLLVFGTGAAIGLHIGLLHFVIWRSPWWLAILVASSLLFSGVTYALWRWVFPRLGARSLPGSIALQAAETFFRAHKSSLVNLKHVHEIQPWFGGRYKLVMRDQARSEVALSRVQARALRARLRW